MAFGFMPIMGKVSSIAVNVRLRQLHQRIDELEARLAEVVVGRADSGENDGDEPFEWRTSEDCQALKDYAQKEFGQTIKGNKKPETIRAEIEALINDG